MEIYSCGDTITQMSNNLKKALTLIITIGIAILFIFWYIGKENLTNNRDESNETDKLVLVSQDESRLKVLAEKDSDLDGLYDWEEELWGTDPQNSDTDFDGTKDGAEVDLGRDPNLAGPNDEFRKTTSETETTNQNSFTSKDQTVTEAFAKNFFSNYTTLSGPGLDPQYQNIIFDQLINSSEQGIETEIKVSINQSSINTQESYKNYGNNIAKVINDNTKDTSDFELDLLQSYLLYGNNADLEKVRASKDGYLKMAKEMEQISVPSNLAEEHTNLVKSLYQTENGLQSLLTIDQDPVRASFGINQYETAIDLTYKTLDSIRFFLVKEGVSYSKDEPAYIFIYL